MATKICKYCLDKDEFEYCANSGKCGTFTHNETFCKWLLQHENFIAMAHNLKGFVAFFIIQHFINSMLPTDTWPSMIVNGTETISIMLRNLKIVDS